MTCAADKLSPPRPMGHPGTGTFWDTRAAHLRWQVVCIVVSSFLIAVPFDSRHRARARAPHTGWTVRDRAHDRARLFSKSREKPRKTSEKILQKTPDCRKSFCAL